MKTTVKFAKVKEGAIIPSKRKEDAGYDIYPCFEQDYIKIEPHETVMIPTGIASSFSEDYVMELKERGSTGTKGIAQRCGVIDSGFRNEWQVPITNTTEQAIYIMKNNYDIIEYDGYTEYVYPHYNIQRTNGIIIRPSTPPIIYPYEKAICQALLLPVPETDIEEISYEELKLIKSERGNGMLGSSGK